MAIAFDAITGVQLTTGTSLTYSHTCTGSDRILFVSANNNTASDYVTGITYNGVSMTKIGASLQGGSTRYTNLYYLVAPATGANNVVISCSGSTYIEAYTVSYTGVHQSSPIDTNRTDTGSSVTSLTCTLTTTADQCWLITAGSYGAGTLSGGASTYARNVSFSYGILDSNGARSIGSNSLIINSSSSNAGFITAAFKPTANAYTLALAAGAFTYTGVATGLLYGRKLALDAGSYILTGVAVAMMKGFGMIMATGSYALTGIDVALQYGRIMALSAGSYVLTGIAVAFNKGYTIVMATGSYILTGLSVILRPSRIWTNITANVATWINRTRN